MNKKIVSLILIIYIIFTLSGITSYGQSDTTAAEDLKGHWAESTLATWMDMGLLHGYADGTVHPDGTVTKAEFITFVNRIFGYYETAETNYTDVSNSDWFAEQAAIAKGSGYMDWYQQEHLNPKQAITRQDVCAILYAVMQLQVSEDMASLQGFSDHSTIPEWSRVYVAGAVEKGYLGGYPDKTLRVENSITRAEAMVMLNKVMGKLINTSGAYGSEGSIDTVKSNVTINVEDVVIQNQIIEGDLIIGAGVQEGNVEIKNVTVKGRTIVNGGGENSVIIQNSEMDELIVFKVNGKIRVVSSNSAIGKVIQKSGGHLKGAFGGASIEVLAQGRKVELEGEFDKLIIHTKADIEITGETKVRSIEMKAGSGGTQIVTQKGTKVDKITFDAPAHVKGEGTIKKAIVNSNDVVVEQKVGNIVVAEGIDGSHIKEQSISDSSSHKSNSDTTAPSGYSVSVDQAFINKNNENACSFTIENAEVACTYYYSIDDTNDTTQAVTGNGRVDASSHTVQNIDVSGLDDDVLTWTVYLKDNSGNTGESVIDIADKDTVLPGGYRAVIEQSLLNGDNEEALSFLISDAEVGTTFVYSIDDTNEMTTSVTGKNNISISTMEITGIDVSSLDDGILTLKVHLTDEAGNQGTDVTDTVDKDATAPSGYSVSIDQSWIDPSNENALSFTINNAEVGANFTYTIASDGAGTDVTDSGTIGDATTQITGVDVSGLGDGVLTVSVTLADANGNAGNTVEATVNKDTGVPTGYSVSIDQGVINDANKDAMSFSFSNAEAGSTYSYSVDDTNGGTSAVTGSGAITASDQNLSGINVSSLIDGTLTVTVYLADEAGNQGSTVTDTVEKDTVIPTGYGAAIDQSFINFGNEEALSFTFSGAEVNAVYHYSIDDANGGTPPVTGSGTIATATDQITGIDVSSLDDGSITLTMYLADEAGNQGTDVTDTVDKDATAPSGYSVGIDQSLIDPSNENALSFAISGGEVGVDFAYTIASDGGGTDVTGSGTIGAATTQISGIDVSGLGDGVLTVSVTLTDTNGNIGNTIEATVKKDTTAPSGYSVAIDQETINDSNKEAMSFTFSNAEVGTDYEYTITSDAGGTDVTGSGEITAADQNLSSINVAALNDGILTLTVYLKDEYGNQGSDETDTADKDTVIPTGYGAAIDQSFINSGNEDALSFTFSSAEPGTTYSYAVDDTNGSTSPVTGNGTIATATDQITGIDVSSLDDGSLALTVYLADEAGNQGTDVTDTVDKDATAPSGYSVSIDQSWIDPSNENALSFIISGGEVGVDFAYTIASDGGGTDVTDSGTIGAATTQITGIDVSGLSDGVLTVSVTLTDTNGNAGNMVEATVKKDTTAPSGYSVAIDQEAINDSKKEAMSFTFSNAEVGTDYEYTITSDAGGTDATGSGEITAADQTISSINVAALNDGILTLTVCLTDVYGNQGSDETDTADKDTVIPTGYGAAIDQSFINSGNEDALSFTFSSAEVGAAYHYSIDDTNGGTSPVTGSGTIATAADQITGIDVSSLDDVSLTLMVYLADEAGNQGALVTDTVDKDATAPSGYSVSIDQSLIDPSNENALSFAISGGEVGANFAYTIASEGGGTDVTDSGTIATATDQITGIDVSGLGDGVLTVSVTLTDTNGNIGNTVEATVKKDTTAPSGYSVDIDQEAINDSNKEAMSFTFSNAEIGADYEYTITSDAGGTDVTGSGEITAADQNLSSINVAALNDGSLTLTVCLTDVYGNQGSDETDTADKDTVIPTGYGAAIDQSFINSDNEDALSFTFSSAEVGAAYHYSIDDTNGGTSPVTGSGQITSGDQNASNIDVASLDDGTLTLTVYLIDEAGNGGYDVSDTVDKDATAPSGYTVSINQSKIDSSNEKALSFTISDGEAGASYEYIISSDGGGTDVTGSGSIGNVTMQVTGIDVSGLGDGELTVSVTLTDAHGNQGNSATDTVDKPAQYADIEVSGYNFEIGGSGNDTNGNGIYTFDGMINGKPSFRREAGGYTYIIKWEYENEYAQQWEWDLWRNGEGIYYNATDTYEPPNSNWYYWINEEIDDDFTIN